jgi:hypothetical protein
LVQRLLHDGDVAGGAGFLCGDIPVRADAGARASGRRRDASYGVIDTSPVDTAWTL